MSALFKTPSFPEPPKGDDPAIADARRREQQAAKNRAGRSSTILTGPSGLSGDSLAPGPTLLGT